MISVIMGGMAHRIRVGQQYLLKGVEGKPSGQYLNVKQVEPLIVRWEGWNGYSDDRPPEPYDAETLLSLKLLRDPDLNDAELAEVLVGRTIVAVRVDHIEDDFPMGDGDVELTLDDGRVVEFDSHGYDAWGMSVSVIPPLS
jgi:hypothetical protein